jgi:hypothetical protein
VVDGLPAKSAILSHVWLILAGDRVKLLRRRFSAGVGIAATAVIAGGAGAVVTLEVLRLLGMTGNATPHGADTASTYAEWKTVSRLI